MRISKHSLFRLKITVGCRLCAYPSIHVEILSRSRSVARRAHFRAFTFFCLKITVGCLTNAYPSIRNKKPQDHGRLRVVCVCAECVLCVVVYCCVLVCNVVCVVSVVSVMCCVSLCGVCGAAWHAQKPPVCMLKTSLYVGSKRLRVYRQNARMLKTCARFTGIHGGVSETC